MKKYFLGSLTFLLLCSLLFVACNKDDHQLDSNTVTEDAPILMLDGQAPPPDLTITLYDTDLSSTTLQCGTDAPLPSVHCNGGDRTFTATVTIKNIGVGALPADTLEVFWYDFYT